MQILQILKYSNEYPNISNITNDKFGYLDICLLIGLFVYLLIWIF